MDATSRLSIDQASPLLGEEFKEVAILKDITPPVYQLFDPQDESESSSDEDEEKDPKY